MTAEAANLAPTMEHLVTTYLDPQRFPVTTQKGLDYHYQQMIDAHNLDELNEMVRKGKPMDAEQKAAHKELLEKTKIADEAAKLRDAARQTQPA